MKSACDSQRLQAGNNFIVVGPRNSGSGFAGRPDFRIKSIAFRGNIRVGKKSQPEAVDFILDGGIRLGFIHPRADDPHPVFR